MGANGAIGVAPSGALRIPYKILPITAPAPAYPGEKFTWAPILSVSLIINHRPTKRFEAIVDSGAATCLFHANFATACGLKVDSVQPEPLGGIIGGAKGSVFYHEVKLVVPGGGGPIKITAGFSPQLAVAALLGRHGFFEHFTVTFDACATPPCLVLERFHRA